MRGNATSHPAGQLSCPQASPGREDFILVHKELGRHTGKACLLHLLQQPGSLTLEQPLTRSPPDTWIRLGSDCYNRGRAQEPRWGACSPRILSFVFSSSGYFPQVSCQGMAGAARNHMKNLACCFDTGNSQEDGKLFERIVCTSEMLCTSSLKNRPWVC